MRNTIRAGKAKPLERAGSNDAGAQQVDERGLRDSTGVSGAIARAAQRSAAASDSLDPLPELAHRLIADRARAINQRDDARRRVEELTHQLNGVRQELAAALARIAGLEAARND